MPAALPIVLALMACSSGRLVTEGPDGQAEIFYSDQDGDTIIDLHEDFVDPESPIYADDTGEIPSSPDTDGDGTADFLDVDTDGDGIGDEVEAGDADPITFPWDSDFDGIPDFRDLDSDGNCVPDAEDGTADLDGDGLGASSDRDDDGDGILDEIEIGAGCALLDSDGDGTPDYLDLDSDGDGVGDAFEAGTSIWEDQPDDADGDGVPNYLDLDSDDDGILDSAESGGGDVTAEPRDTDGDGSYDFLDDDADGDGLSDRSEISSIGTDPYSADSDGDGFSDGAEVQAGTNPLDGSSVIQGLYVRLPERTSVEEAFEFELNIQMGDVAFLLDTTGSMGGTIDGMKAQYGDIVAALSAALPDAEYGVATFDDYAYSPYGDSGRGDRPFILKQQITSDVSRVQSALSSISLHYGGDDPESGMEGLYQALTGRGYDQACDHGFNSDTDVRPFIANSGDAFGGAGGQSYAASSPGGGLEGGMGFRPYALPVIVYATDNYLRDPDGGYGVPNPSCSHPAGFSSVVSAATGSGAYLIGIAASSSTPLAQMNDLANATLSRADTDGDGYADDNLVFSWSGSSSTLRDTIVNAVSGLVGSVRISDVTLEVVGDSHGFVKSISPEVYHLSGTASGQQLDFTLGFRGTVAATSEDQIFLLTLNVIGDGSILLDTLDIFVLVPGSSY
ncbi:MAG: hypothetical protein JXX28_12490 [Deltaproteobacteria bacterium]|nr:hypothetical protein [Deltaproteobacteria bacterium]